MFVEWPGAVEPELEPERIALRLRLSHLGGDRRGVRVTGRPDLVERLEGGPRVT